MALVVADLGRRSVVVDLFRPLGYCRPPLQPEATFAAPFCIRSEPDEDDIVRSSVPPELHGTLLWCSAST